MTDRTYTLRRIGEHYCHDIGVFTACFRWRAVATLLPQSRGEPHPLLELTLSTEPLEDGCRVEVSYGQEGDARLSVRGRLTTLTSYGLGELQRLRSAQDARAHSLRFAVWVRVAPLAPKAL